MFSVYGKILNNETIKNMLLDTLDVKMEGMFQKLQQPMTHIMNESEKRVTTKLETIHSLTDKNNTTQDTMSKELSDYLNKLKHSSSLKGHYSENKLLMILENMYPQSNIEMKPCIYTESGLLLMISFTGNQ